MRAILFWAISLILSLVLSAPNRAEAACISFDGNRRELVGTLPDLFFTAGVPSTQYLNHVYLNFDVPNTGPVGDCGVSAITYTTGISIQQTYGGSAIYPAGQSAFVDKAMGYSSPLVEILSGPPDVSGPIPIIYDGTTPAGTQGVIELWARDGDINPLARLLGRANVYIISGTAPKTWFTVTTIASNISGDSVTLNSALLNGVPQNRLLVQHTGTPAWNHPIAATYNSGIGRWQIRNEDGTTMPLGLTFTVRIDPNLLAVQSASIAQNWIRIDDPVANGNPYATIVVAPYSSGGRRNTRTFGVGYAAPPGNPEQGYWYILATDGLNFDTTDYVGTVGFYVRVVGASIYADDNLWYDPSGITSTYLSNGAGIDIVALGSARASGSTRYLRDFCFTTNTSALPIVTYNATPLPPWAPINYNAIEGKRYGVSFSVNVMTIFHEDGSTLYGSIPFNVLAPYRTDCSPH